MFVEVGFGEEVFEVDFGDVDGGVYRVVFLDFWVDFAEYAEDFAVRGGDLRAAAGMEGRVFGVGGECRVLYSRAGEKGSIMPFSV